MAARDNGNPVDPVGHWRTRRTDDHEFLRYMLYPANPLLDQCRWTAMGMTNEEFRELLRCTFGDP